VNGNRDHEAAHVTDLLPPVAGGSSPSRLRPILVSGLAMWHRLQFVAFPSSTAVFSGQQLKMSSFPETQGALQRLRPAQQSTGSFSSCCLTTISQTNLTHSTKVYRLTQNSDCFLARMKAGRILGFDEIEIELCFALKVSRLL